MMFEVVHASKMYTISGHDDQNCIKRRRSWLQSVQVILYINCNILKLRQSFQRSKRGSLLYFAHHFTSKLESQCPTTENKQTIFSGKRLEKHKINQQNQTYRKLIKGIQQYSSQ
ncbi:Pleckstrin_homology domain [Hexamita inflata]|uniref:Pleckstrin homology domain n=1 Tax=Hexamita inflata TaxID=28002 RepID=A0AA86UFH7_9EUKA|nr:Pleckstrin homology domain [Hexamita inflata]